MPRAKRPKQIPLWERRRLLASMDSDLESSGLLFTESHGTEEEQQFEEFPERAQALNRDGSVPLPNRSDRRNDPRDWFTPFDNAPIESVPAYLIDRLIQPDSFYERFPWPYSLIEIRQILDNIPNNKRIYVSYDVIYLARIFLLKQKSRRVSHRKPDPAGELSRFRAAVRELDAAIDALSSGAHRHFAPPSPPRSRRQEDHFRSLPEEVKIELLEQRERNISIFENKSHFSTHDLHKSLIKFQIDNKIALDDLPVARELRGRPLDQQADLRARFDDIFLAAHDGMMAGGRWEFNNACSKPLKINHLSHEGVEKAIARAKLRRQKEHK